MAISLFLDLIDLCIKLVDRRSERNKNYLNEVVTPLHDAFQAVHQRYLDDFAKYIKLVSDPKLPPTSNHPVFDELRRDNLFTEHDRNALMTIAVGQNGMSIDNLITSIQTYLYGAVTLQYELPSDIRADAHGGYQIARNHATVTLGHLFAESRPDEEKRAEAIRGLEDAVVKLQHLHATVIYCYHYVKLELSGQNTQADWGVTWKRLGAERDQLGLDDSQPLRQ